MPALGFSQAETVPSRGRLPGCRSAAVKFLNIIEYYYRNREAFWLEMRALIYKSSINITGNITIVE
jgi:hypothetical protein